jgi:hypothetical protein
MWQNTHGLAWLVTPRTPGCKKPCQVLQLAARMGYGTISALGSKIRVACRMGGLEHDTRNGAKDTGIIRSQSDG